MGFSYSELLKMTPSVFASYWKTYQEEQQEKADLMDYQAWLNGLYFMTALGCSFSKSEPYPKASFTRLESDKKYEEENPNEVAAINFKNWASQFNRGKRGDE